MSLARAWRELNGTLISPTNPVDGPFALGDWVTWTEAAIARDQHLYDLVMVERFGFCPVMVVSYDCYSDAYVYAVANLRGHAVAALYACADIRLATQEEMERMRKIRAS